MLRNRVYRAVPKHFLPRNAIASSPGLVEAGAMVQDGMDVDIALGGRDMLMIDNVTISKLTAIDFVY